MSFWRRGFAQPGLHVSAGFLEIGWFAASLSYASVGAFMNWCSPVLPRLQRADSELPLSASAGSWVASGPLLTAAAAVLAVPLFFDRVGRRSALLATAAPLAAGFAWLAAARAAWELLAARSLLSVAAAAVVSVLPAYLAEVSADARRGAALACCQLLHTLGGLVTLCLGAWLPYRAYCWALLAMPALFFATFVWMPESPYYLLMQGRKEAAATSLRRLRGRSDVSAELVQAETTLAQQCAALPRGGAGVLASLRHLATHRADWRTLLLAVGFSVLSSATGMAAVLSYSGDIMARAGDSLLSADASAALLGAVQVGASCASAAAVDKLGRRPLSLISFAGCALSLFAEGGYFYFMDVARADVSALHWLPLAALVVYVVAYTMGIGTLVWTVSAEMFSVPVKGVSMSVVTLTYSLSMFAVTKLFQDVADAAGVHTLFWGFAACAVVGFWYVYLLIPETKGKSLLGISTELSAKLSA
ncbi:facilitated trehalose transporter Tret1-like [Schistocerca serialis cubense]|uniref:facilitated trehalose transporter Tret1-like n=1 Tax=Schistocerca serialis cubense TaxID=2023355 RepID=UPI00214DF430|nr:facilitated trehalose transporter Tret1-like [Schistocerca serialis cubense]